MFVLGLSLLAISVAYPVVAVIWRKPIAFGRYRLRPPSFTLALSLMLVFMICFNL
jgi:hypothetical protein